MTIINRTPEDLVQSSSEQEITATCPHHSRDRFKRDDGSEMCQACRMELFGPYVKVPKEESPVQTPSEQVETLSGHLDFEKKAREICDSESARKLSDSMNDGAYCDTVKDIAAALREASELGSAVTAPKSQEVFEPKLPKAASPHTGA